MRKAEALPSSVVLDTHAWVWACAGDRRMRFLEGYAGRCVVSAISVWEIGMLAAKDRLALTPSVTEWVARNLEPPVFLQALTPAIALRSSTLADFHGDPADRMIVATALVLGQPLLSADARIARWFAGNREWKGLFREI